MNSVGRISGIPTQASNYSTTFTALVYATTQRTSASTTMSERVQNGLSDALAYYQ
jgi:hypothetical protein